MPIKQFVMLPENMPEMRMETVSVKYMSTPRKVSGPSFAHGCVHIVEYVSQRLPIYLGFFEYIYNTRRRGKTLLADLFETILAPDQRLLANVCPAA